MSSTDKKLPLIDSFHIDIPQWDALKGMNSVTTPSYVYCTIYKDMHGMQSFTDYEPYNKKLKELNLDLIAQAENIIKFQESMEFLIPQDSMKEAPEIKGLDSELHPILKVKVESIIGDAASTYKELVDFIFEVGISYRELRELSKLCQTLKLPINLYHVLNEY